MQSAVELEPRDAYNEQLIANVHPPDWVNPRPAPVYNVVVIGGGTAGLVSAAGAAMLGARSALVERRLLGGDCLNTGCVPSKGIIRAARAVHEVRNARGFGVRVPEELELDFGVAMQRMRRVRSVISHHDSARWLSGLGVDVFLGQASFVGRKAVEVGGKRLRFKRAVIATGARPMVPPVEGLHEAGYLTNETVFNLTELPRRLMVVGGGPLGTELAQTFARLGSRVTIVEMLDRFLPNEDADAAKLLADVLGREGVELRPGTRVVRVATETRGKRVTLHRDGVEEQLVVDEILVAVGRAPNVEDLGLEEAGVRYDARSGVDVDDRLRTSNRSIYAAGDVSLRHKFTHTADAAARIVIQNALFPGRKKLSALTVPWCTYTSPEIAQVGLYEHEAEPRGLEIDTHRVELADVDRAILDGATEGFVKVHVKRGTDRILGATIVGEHAGEMISEITLAMVAGVGLRQISEVIHPYPTQAEAIKKVADDYRLRSLTPTVRRWLRRWFAWTR